MVDTSIIRSLLLYIPRTLERILLSSIDLTLHTTLCIFDNSSPTANVINIMRLNILHWGEKKGVPTTGGDDRRFIKAYWKVRYLVDYCLGRINKSS